MKEEEKKEFIMAYILAVTMFIILVAVLGLLK